MLTDQMQQAGELLNIPLMDHVIIGRGQSYYSFKEKGILPYNNIQYAQDIEKINIGGRMVAEEREGIHLAPDKKKQPGRTMRKARHR